MNDKPTTASDSELRECPFGHRVVHGVSLLIWRDETAAIGGHNCAQVECGDCHARGAGFSMANAKEAIRQAKQAWNTRPAQPVDRELDLYHDFARLRNAFLITYDLAGIDASPLPEALPESVYVPGYMDKVRELREVYALVTAAAPLPVETLGDDDTAICPNPSCHKAFSNDMLRDDKRIPTHDFPEPCRSVCLGSGQWPANYAGAKIDALPVDTQGAAQPEPTCYCKTFVLGHSRAYLDSLDFVHTEIACPDRRLEVETVESQSRNTPWSVCPITRRTFFMNLDHPEMGEVPTFGGPFDSYTVPEADDDGELRCERYDHDAGNWVEGGEPTGLWIVRGQPAATQPAWQPSEHTENGLRLLRSIICGGNALRDFDVFSCNESGHELHCKCFWAQCDEWEKADLPLPAPPAQQASADVCDKCGKPFGLSGNDTNGFNSTCVHCGNNTYTTQQASDFCYAKGDEGSLHCGSPKAMHCSVLGDEAFWTSPEGRTHLLACVGDRHLIHHRFVPATPAGGEPHEFLEQPRGKFPKSEYAIDKCWEVVNMVYCGQPKVAAIHMNASQRGR